MSNITRPSNELMRTNGLPVPARYIVLESADETTASQRGNGAAEAWELVLSKKWTLVTTLLVAGFLGAAYTVLQRPEYRAVATIEMEAPGGNLGLIGLPADSQEDAFMQTQVRILESKSLRQKVDRVLATERRDWYVRPSRLEIWVKSAGLSMATGAATNDLPPVNLTVRGFDRTRLAEIQSESSDPQFAAQYANTVAREFDLMQGDARVQSAQHAGTWISGQIEEVRETLRRAESELESFSRNAGHMYGVDQQSADQTKLIQLEGELSRARADRIQKQSNFEIARETSAETVPQVADDGKLSTYALKLSDLRRDLAELRTQMTPEHYKVRQVEAQITELESIVREERANVIARIWNDYNVSQRREQLLQASYDATKKIVKQQAGEGVYYDLLKREVESDRKLYDELLEKSKAATLASAMTGSTVRMIDRAEVPTTPFKPTPIQNMTVAAISGLVLGFGLIVLSDHLNRSLKAPGETPYHLGIPELGIIPAYEADQAQANRAKRLRPTIWSEPANTAALVPIWKDSSSAVAESFRSTVASILSSAASGANQRVILITSLGRGDGKSSTVASLGMALAEINQRVLLIDADMRKPHLHHLFGISNSWGLTNLLREKTSLKDMPVEAFARRTDVPDLFLLPGGPGTATIAGLLYSKRLRALIDRVRGDFDVILIDTPPMSYMSDARVLGRVADAAVLVIRAGRTTRDEALAVKERLVADGTHLLGTILNGWDSRAKSRYSYYNYGEPTVNS